MSRLSGVQYLEASGAETSPIWLWGVPYDGTASQRPGARFGPDEIRAASQGIESWSPYLKRDLLDLSIHDAGNLEISFSVPERASAEIHAFARSLFGKGKRSCALGGEHSASPAIIRAAFEHHPRLAVVHFDAHCDMRESYGGTPLSHASAARRILDFLPSERYFAFGMRAGERAEFAFAGSLPHFHPFTVSGVRKALEAVFAGQGGGTGAGSGGGRGRAKRAESGARSACSGRAGRMKMPTLYVTLDLDVLDPSCFPGTGAPEPVGVSVRELHEAVLSLDGLPIVGADVMELAPHYDPSHASSSVAAFFARELLLMMG
jgi:agmatinase